MRNFSILLFLGVIAATSFAQAPTWIHYTSGNKINDIAFEGPYVWVATQGGLACYDKNSHSTVFYNRANSPLPINEIFSIAIGADGLRWLGTRIGLVRWKDNTATVLNPSGSQLVIWHVRLDINGDIWMRVAGNTYSLRRFDGQEWYAYDDDALFGGLTRLEARPSAAGIWVEGNNALFQFDGIIVTPHPLPGDLEDPPGVSILYDWAVDSDGQAWFICGNQLGVPAGNTWFIQMIGMYADAMAVSDDGTVWFVSNFNGVRKRTPNGQIEIVSDQYVPTNDISLKLFAENGDVAWLGTETEGLMQFEGGDWQDIPVSIAPIPDHSVVELEVIGAQTIWSMFQADFEIDWKGGGSLCRFKDKEWDTDYGYPLWQCSDLSQDGLGRLWVTHYQKLFRYDGQWASIPLPAEFPYGQVYSVCGDPATNHIWIGGYDKIARYNGTDFQVFDTPDAKSVERIAVDQAGDIWLPICGYNNEMLGRFDGQNWEVFSGLDMGLSEFTYFIRDLKVAPNGTLWVLTPDEITRFDGTNWEKLPLEAYALGGEFSCLAFDTAEKVWIGTYGMECIGVNVNQRLIKYENGNFTFYPYQTTPLPYPNITALAVDAYHNVWIGCEYGGIAVFNEGGIVLDASEAPINRALAMIKAYPNPAVETATLEYTLSETSDVLLEWCNASGQRLYHQVYKQQPAGLHHWTVPLATLPNGVFLWRISLRGATAAGVLVKGN